MNDGDYSEEEWGETDNAQFAGVSDFDDLEVVPSISSSHPSYSVGDKTLLQLKKEGNDSKGPE